MEKKRDPKKYVIPGILNENGDINPFPSMQTAEGKVKHKRPHILWLRRFFDDHIYSRKYVFIAQVLLAITLTHFNCNNFLWSIVFDEPTSYPNLKYTASLMLLTSIFYMLAIFIPSCVMSLMFEIYTYRKCGVLPYYTKTKFGKHFIFYSLMWWFYGLDRVTHDMHTEFIDMKDKRQLDSWINL